MSRKKEIAAYFDILQERIDFADEIYRSDREEEAILLCSAFLDALAHATYLEETQNHYHFVKLLCEYSQNQLFSQIHPLQVRYWLAKAKGGWKRDVRPRIESTLEELRGSVYRPERFIEELAGLLAPHEFKKLKQELWHGNVASMFYTNVRCRAVHQLHVSPVSFGDTTFEGTPLPTLNFEFLKTTLEAILEELRVVSEKADKLFGHDFASWRENDA